jgi:branched-subunit amino acid aminotransferase/4-amino-4-deoxychorismate lyase
MPRGFVTPKQYGELHGITRQRVVRLLNEGRFPNAYRVAEGRYHRWYLPQNAKPTPVEMGRPRGGRK